jgi:hypothetical protein
MGACVTEPEALIRLLAGFLDKLAQIRGWVQIEEFPLMEISELFGAVGIRTFRKHAKLPGYSQ